ncbi:MAG: cyclohexanecarboxylate-CoA ligase [Alphaproteobacteria bacterium]|nr:cyclohexanecarboxylate-CoA ligase [Alphaproteobacteria bacterium]
MTFDANLPEARKAAMYAAGHWRRDIIGDYFDRVVAATPDAVAITGRNSTTGLTTTLSWRQLRRLVDRIALGLAAHGVERNDVVAAQLPNWWEFVALYLACVRIGAVMNPLMPIFRHREISFMLDFAQSKVAVVPRTFRGFDHGEMMRELRGSLPHLEHVFVVDGGDEASFEARLLDRRWEDERGAAELFRSRRPGADDVTLLMYTSGTTGEPKGVMHTGNTLLANIHAYLTCIAVSGPQVLLMGSPMAHLTGFLYGLMLAPVLGAKLVLLDIWNGATAARLIHDEGVTFTMGATPFVADLTDTPAIPGYSVDTLKTFVTAGAPIPRVLVERATKRLGVFLHSGWGMTENGCATITRRGDPPEKVFGTDGAALPGMEVRVVDSDGRPVPPDTEGHLQARGAASFVGYLMRPEKFDHDADGWFATGDEARMDPDGYIRITGRAKDIIIRGGENVPVVEVEELLYRHPAVQDAAIVATPDPRLGERGCAFLVLKPGASLSFAAMIGFLEERKMAKQYMPERLEIVPEMPRTPSGKIQKYKLREMAQSLAKG